MLTVVSLKHLLRHAYVAFFFLSSLETSTTDRDCRDPTLSTGACWDIICILNYRYCPFYIVVDPVFGSVFLWFFFVILFVCFAFVVVSFLFFTIWAEKNKIHKLS